MKARKEKATNSPITTFFKKLVPDAKPKRPKVKLNPITSYFSKRKPLAPLSTALSNVEQVDSSITSVPPYLLPPGNLPARNLQEEAKSLSSQPDGFVLIPTPPRNLLTRSLQEGTECPSSQLDGFVIISTPPGNGLTRSLQEEAKSPLFQPDGFVIISPGNLLTRSLQEETECPSSQPDSLVTSITPHSPPSGKQPATEHTSDSSLFNVTLLSPLPTAPVTAPPLSPLPTAPVTAPPLSPLPTEPVTAPPLNPLPTAPVTAPPLNPLPTAPVTAPPLNPLPTAPVTAPPLNPLPTAPVTAPPLNPLPTAPVTAPPLNPLPTAPVTAPPLNPLPTAPVTAPPLNPLPTAPVTAPPLNPLPTAPVTAPPLNPLPTAPVTAPPLNPLPTAPVTAPPLNPLPTEPLPQLSPVLNTPTMPANTEKNCQGDSETSTIVITDSPLLSDSSIVDLTHDSPSPEKRVCLIDLTESSPSLLAPTPLAVNEGEESHTVDEWRQQSMDIVTHSGGEKERTESSSTVMDSVSLNAVAKKVESFHLTTPTNPTKSMVVEHPAHTMLVTASSPLLTSPVPSLVPSLDHTDVSDLLVPPGSLQKELELLLWQRGTPYSEVPTGKVRLFSTVQDNIVDNLLEVTSAVTSRKLHSVLEYLTLTTTATLMPRASILLRLWEMVADPHVAVNRLSSESVLRCVTFLQRLLSLHPPGQHPLVDTQYREFVRSLGEAGGPFATWEWINVMISGPELCAELLSFLINLFLSDFWSCLNSKKEPLFVKVFWPGSGSGSGHVTLPIRKLVDTSVKLMETPGYRDSEFSKLGSCASLLFLVATRCQDLSTELTTACRRLPSDKLLLFISHLQPTSLQVKLLQQTNTAPKLHLILSSIAKQLPSITAEKAQHIPHHHEKERHITSPRPPSSPRSDANTSKTDGSQSTKVQSALPPCALGALVIAQPVSTSVVKADLKSASLNSNKAQHSHTASLASNRFVAPSASIHSQPNPKTTALSSTQRRPLGGTISHCRPTPLPTKTTAIQPNPKTAALSSMQRRPLGGTISHCRPTPLPTKTTATQPNPKTVALSSTQRRPLGGAISHHRPIPLPTKTPATQSSSVKGLTHHSQTLSARSLSAIHKASNSLQAKPFSLSSAAHVSKVTTK